MAAAASTACEVFEYDDHTPDGYWRRKSVDFRRIAETTALVRKWDATAVLTQIKFDGPLRSYWKSVYVRGFRGSLHVPFHAECVLAEIGSGNYRYKSQRFTGEVKELRPWVQDVDDTKLKNEGRPHEDEHLVKWIRALVLTREQKEAIWAKWSHKSYMDEYELADLEYKKLDAQYMAKE